MKNKIQEDLENIYFSFGLAKRNICIVSVLLDAARNIESGLNANEYIVATLKEIIHT